MPHSLCLLPSRFSKPSILVVGALLSVAVSGPSPLPASSALPAKEPARLTIERLYSLPRLTGTAPSGFAWSRDGRYLAFLWNDEGRNFRDVWVVDVNDPALVPNRLTRMPKAARLPVPMEDPVARATAEERVERDSGISSVVWHPDGESLLISFEGDLWLVERDSGSGAAPARLTETVDAEFQPAYSPDGSFLAFLRGGDLWTMAASARSSEGMADSEPPLQRTSVVVSEGPRRDVEISRFAWSPDSHTIAVLEANRTAIALRGVPDYLSEETRLSMIRRAYPGEPAVVQRLGVLDMGSRAVDIEWVELAGPAPDMVLDFAWSPNGRYLGVDTSDHYAKDRQVIVVDTELASRPIPRLVARDRDLENESFYFWRIAWSRDGRSLYFLSDRDEDYHVYAVAPNGGKVRRLTQGPWAVAEMHPVAGGLVVVGNRSNGEERHLYRVGDGGERNATPLQLSVRAGTHTPVVSPNGRFAAVAFSSDDTPPDLWLTDLGAERNERRVTRSPIPDFASFHWVTPRYVTFPSHVDGTTLHGRLTLPPDFDPNRRYPAILGSVYTDSVRNQWGGRTAHPTWGLDQYLAQEGYILLNVDMRGSWGRGRDHRRGIRLDYGGLDIEDLESGVRYLTGLGYVDPKRVGIWGSSYGGLMTAMSLFRKPGLYAAGVAGAPATNVWHALTGQMAVMMRPKDQDAEYADSSPFRHAHGLQDPLMIIHGMRDWVVLFKDSVILTQRLIQLGKDVDLVTLPNAGHGWDNEGLAQTRYAFRKLVEHFNEHLGDSKEPDSRSE